MSTGGGAEVTDDADVYTCIQLGLTVLTAATYQAFPKRWSLIKSSYYHHEAASIIPTLQLKKLKFRDAKRLAQSHTAGK